MEVLPKRFGKYGLDAASRQDPADSLSPSAPQGGRLEGMAGTIATRPGTFDLLGFTHYWGRTLRGGWAVMRQTASKRLSRAVRSIAQWCRINRHRPVCEQHYTLSQKVRGHYAYYGITNNMRMLKRFLNVMASASLTRRVVIGLRKPTTKDITHHVYPACQSEAPPCY